MKFWRKVRSCCAAVIALLLAVQLVYINPQYASASEQAQEPLSTGSGTAYYVSAQHGDDMAGDGSLANPWASIQRAADVAQAGDTVYIREGVYRETVTPANSGSEQHTIVYRNYEDELVVIDGTEPVTGWQSEGGGIFSAEALLPLGHGNQVFAGGEMMTEARWPNNAGGLLDPTFAIMSAGTPTTITSSELPAGVDPVGANVWFRGGSGWAGLDSVITAYHAATSTMTMEPVGSTGTHYDARAGNPFFLWGKREFLDAEKEWWYDELAGKLYFMPPGGAMPEQVEVKARTLSFDLSGKSHIELIGLHTRANTILTDDASSDLLFDRMKLEYVSHMTRTPNKDGRPPDLYRGMQLKGSNHVLRNSEVAYSSSGLLFVSGQNHTILNNYLHDGNYWGTWGGLVTLGGQEHYVGYNTMTRAGRDVMNMGGASKVIVEHNDLSHGALIVNDTAMIYTPNTDGMGTEIRYNKVHDINPNAYLGIGIYFDHFARNYIIHHNVIWNIPNADPIRLNAPSNFNLVYNNTMATNTVSLSASGSRYGGDMYGVRLFNNIINATVNYLERSDLAHGNNIFISAGQDPAFVDADNFDFRLTPGSQAVDNGMVIPGITDGYSGSAPDIGAYELGQSDFIAGHDFNANPVPNRSFSVTPYANRVINSGFETYQLDPWVAVSGAPEVLNAGGAAWSSDDADARSNRASLRLGGEQGEVEQTVTGLAPNTRYSFSVWSKVEDDSAVAEFGVRGFGGTQVTGTNDSTGWTFATVDFVTGPTDTEATVFLRKTAGATGSGTLYRLGGQLIPEANAPYLYDVSSFIRSERYGDGIASLILKVEKSSADKRVTFATREATDPARRPELIVTYADNTVQTLLPTEDAGVKYRNTEGYTDANTGASSSLNVSYHNDGFIENMYLKFDLSALQPQDIADVQLQLYAVSKNSASNPVSTTIYGLTDDSWQETQLVWENRPEEIAAAEGLVYFDDAGLIVPLDDSDPNALIRDRLMEAQHMVRQHTGTNEIAPAIIADLEAAIGTVSARLNQPLTLPELLQELETITAKVAAFRARERLAGLIREVRQTHDAAQEGELSGQYLPGSRAELLAAAEAALAVTNAPASDEAAVEAAMDELQEARALFGRKLVLQDVALLEKADMGAMLADDERWSAGFDRHDGFSSFRGTISKYNEIIGDKVFTFGMKYTFADETEWPGLVLRSQNPSLPVLGSGDTSYFIIFKKNVWELQKRINGTQVSMRSFPNEHLPSGATSKVDAGAIDVVGGVRLFVYVDGRKVFDLIDTEDPIGPGYMGFVPQGGRSDGIHVREDDTPELTLQGPAVVPAGERFDMDVRIDHVDGLAASGIELELAFDDNQIAFLGAEPLVEGITLTEGAAPAEGTLAGTMRLTAESSDEPVLLNAGDQVIRLKLQAKEQAKGQEALTTLTPIRAALKDDDSRPVPAAMYDKAVWIAEAADEPGGPPGPGPGPGVWPIGEPPGAEQPNEDRVAVTLDGQGGEYRLLGGELEVRLPAGAGPAGELSAERLPVPPQAGPLRPVSPAYKLELAGADAWPAGGSIAIAYDAELLQGTDIRKLGVYRLNEDGSWTYAGGVALQEEGAIVTVLEAPGTYAVLAAEVTFADLAGHWAKDTVEVLAAKHLVSGVAADRFEPGRAITRAEFAKLIVELVRALDRYRPSEAGRGTTAPVAFLDVEESAWYAEFVLEASALGLIQGANGRFRPGDSITREEMMVIIARAIAPGGADRSHAESEAALRPYRDLGELSDWARAAAAYLVQAGLIQGYNSALHPAKTLTRAEAATILLNVLAREGGV